MEIHISCGARCARASLHLCNIIFIILGILLIVFGASYTVNDKLSSIIDQFTGKEGFKPLSFGFLAFAMIGGGIFTLLIALFGCIGTVSRKQGCLYFYALMLFILMIIELAGFIIAFRDKSKLKNIYEKSLFDVFNNGFSNDDQVIINAFYTLEGSMKCCGVHGMVDYDAYFIHTFSEGCQKYPNDGCSQKLIDRFNKSLTTIAGSLLSVFIFELFGIITAIACAPELNHLNA